MKTLVVTNDFPPRQGGIQTFVAALLARTAPESLVVLASRSPGWEAHDAALPYPVVRRPTSMLLPTRATARDAVALVREHGCDTAFFGAAAPLGLLGPALRDAGVRRVVGATHGHETGWVALPGARQLMRRIAGGLDLLTYISEYTHARLAPALGARVAMAQLSPGVDVEAFTPDADGAAVRRRYGLGEGPVVVCVSRLVARKGQDVLVEAWPRVLARHPGATLLLVGGGPLEASLRRTVAARGLERSVVLTGPVAAPELPAHYAAGDVFAMPCRTRRGGLDVEGLGMVYLEAAACGLPVVAGTSGGAPEAVQDGVTGHVVEPRSPDAVATAITGLLDDPATARAMGAAGRAWVEQRWSWTTIAATFDRLLNGGSSSSGGVASGHEPGEPASRDHEVIARLRGRDGALTEVRLTDGRSVRVWNIAWGYDAGDSWAHITTNISPDIAGEDTDFFFTHEVDAIRAPESGELLLPPRQRE